MIPVNMDFFNHSSPVNLTLARDRVRSLKRGHPWVFGEYLTAQPGAPAGSFALLRAKDGSVVAQGFYDHGSHLAFRACAVNPQRLDNQLIGSRLAQALGLRRQLFDQQTTGFRLLNGEGDGLPGLVCDLYGDAAVIQLDGSGPAGFWKLDAISEWLAVHAGCTGVMRKRRAGEGEEISQVLRGQVAKSPADFVENGLRFEADLWKGQKTGFFFDQRENRERIRTLAGGRRVLNLFSYTGGFSLYAAAGGAASVTTVDSAKEAVAAAGRNWELNGFPAAQHEAVAADVFEFLQAAKSARRSWDLVIVDPPSFAPGKQHVDAAREGYIRVFASSLGVTTPGGSFAASSCSSRISPELFIEICEEAFSKAKRRGAVLGVFGQPADHPFPLACRELQYLKFVLFNVD